MKRIIIDNPILCVGCEDTIYEDFGWANENNEIECRICTMLKEE